MTINQIIDILGRLILWLPSISNGIYIKTINAAIDELEKLDWVPVDQALPKNEQTVLITVECRPKRIKPYRRVVRAFFTDGKHTDNDSLYMWDHMDQDVENWKDDVYHIPEGWWESVYYSEEFSPIDDKVIAWIPLPEAYTEDKL